MPTADTIYEVPLILEESGLGAYIARDFGSRRASPISSEWRMLVEQDQAAAAARCRIALVGKYVELHDAYMSVAESLDPRRAVPHDVDVEIDWVNSETVTPEELERTLRTRLRHRRAGPGFGPRGTEGKIAAARFAREHGIPYLGLCYGLHMAVIEVARNRLRPRRRELDRDRPRHALPGDRPDARPARRRDGRHHAPRPVAVPAGAGHQGRRGLRRPERLRAPPPPLRGQQRLPRRSWPTPASIVSGASPDGQLAEIMELRDHPFFVGVQFHPEFRSRPTRPHPLFRDFIGAAKATLPGGRPARAAAQRRGDHDAVSGRRTRLRRGRLVSVSTLIESLLHGPVS